jgi:hypothetical protein
MSLRKAPAAVAPRRRRGWRTQNAGAKSGWHPKSAKRLGLRRPPAAFKTLAQNPSSYAQKFMRKSRGHFVCWQSARRLAHSKTLARNPVASEKREASWTAAAPRRFSQRHIKLCQCYLELPWIDRHRRNVAALQSSDWPPKKVSPTTLSSGQRLIYINVDYCGGLPGSSGL